MEWLNYHHLHYFWRVARDGSITAAAANLRVTHSTLSTQVQALEAFFGAPLFERRGKRLVLTEFGADVAVHADDIFRMGSELMDMARGRGSARRAQLRVGMVSSLPKSVAHELMAPILADGTCALTVRQDSMDRLMEELAANRLHAILADHPAAPGGPFRVQSTVVARSQIVLYAAAPLARRLRPGFPGSLEGAPLLLPMAGTTLRRIVERWLAERGIAPRVVAEFDDAGLLRTFGAKGHGVFPVRSILAHEVEDRMGSERVGELVGMTEVFFAITPPQRLRHETIQMLIDRAEERVEGLARRPRNSGHAAAPSARKRARSRPKEKR